MSPNQLFLLSAWMFLGGSWASEAWRMDCRKYGRGWRTRLWVVLNILFWPLTILLYARR